MRFTKKKFLLNQKNLSTIKTGQITNVNQRFFHVSFSVDKIAKEVTFLDLLKTFREIVYKANGKINVLSDDISVFYSSKSYPKIHGIENLLRKLISKFMLVNLGMDWSSSVVPNEVKKSITTKRSHAGVTDILHDVDFIQLADFLFKPYATKGIEGLYSSIKQIESDPKFDNKALLEYIPKSNWERYFSNIVDCEDGYLLKRWERLYELRCKVAHNTLLSKTEFVEITDLTEQVEAKLKEALGELDKIIIPEDDKESLQENVASNLNELNGEFLEKWKNLQIALLTVVVQNAKLGKEELKLKATMSTAVKLAEKHNVLDKNIISRIDSINKTRNLIVHDVVNDFNESELKTKIEELKILTRDIKMFDKKSSSA